MEETAGNIKIGKVGPYINRSWEEGKVVDVRETSGILGETQKIRA